MDRRTFVSATAATAASSLLASRAQAHPAPKAKNVVLVHGLFADGSCWSEVIPRLQMAGLNVTAVQNPLTTLPEADGPGRTFVFGNDRHRRRYASDRVGPCLCGGASTRRR
jgi:hypothetical protein